MFKRWQPPGMTTKDAYNCIGACPSFTDIIGAIVDSAFTRARKPASLCLSHSATNCPIGSPFTSCPLQERDLI